MAHSNILSRIPRRWDTPRVGGRPLPREPAKATTDPCIGAECGERYVPVRRVGIGSIGTVYEARHIVLSKRFALKVLSEQHASRPREVERFLRAVDHASGVRHAAIVSIDGYGTTHDGRAFVATEWMEDPTLEAVLRREGRLTWPRAQQIILQVVAALVVAHRRLALHGALRPVNCFVRPHSNGRETIKVSDFEIAIVGASGHGARDAPYLPPERATSRSLTTQGDVYALGAILYRVLTGETPRDDANRLRAPREIEPTIPADVERVLLRALAEDPLERYNVDEMERALTAIPGVIAPVAAIPKPSKPSPLADTHRANEPPEPSLLISRLRVPSSLGEEKLAHEEATANFTRAQISDFVDPTTWLTPRVGVAAETTRDADATALVMPAPPSSTPKAQGYYPSAPAYYPPTPVYQQPIIASAVPPAPRVPYDSWSGRAPIDLPRVDEDEAREPTPESTFAGIPIWYLLLAVLVVVVVGVLLGLAIVNATAR